MSFGEDQRMIWGPTVASHIFEPEEKRNYPQITHTFVLQMFCIFIYDYTTYVRILYVYFKHAFIYNIDDM